MENTVKERKFCNFYTRGEEIFNAVSHIAGGGLGLLYWAVLLFFAHPSAVAQTAVSLFGFGVVVLYTMSALYHFLPQGAAKNVFRIFDHCTIFLLIAGTYTPFCLLGVGGAAGLILLVVEWVCAAAGITMNAIAMNCKVIKGISMALYFIMGWAALAFFPLLIRRVSLACILLLLAGGIAYTSGIVFFAFGKKVRYFHSVWHLFDIAGTTLQFFAVLLLLV